LSTLCDEASTRLELEILKIILVVAAPFRNNDQQHILFCPARCSNSSAAPQNGMSIKKIYFCRTLETGGHLMPRGFSKSNGVVLASALLAATTFGAVPSALAGTMTVDGQTFWTGDPGPGAPGPYYESGQQRFDPHHYLSWYGEDPQDYKMIVHAPHSGNERCVWRKRVITTNWEFRHPFILVCN
jgi:hypothetical protein